MKQLGVFLLPLDGMLVHRRSLPRNLLGFPNNSPVPIYTPGWSEALWELSVLPKNTTQCPRPGLEPGPLAPGSERTHWPLGHCATSVARQVARKCWMRSPLISKNLLLLPCEKKNRGLRMTDFNILIKALKVGWIPGIKSENVVSWKIIRNATLERWMITLLHKL